MASGNELKPANAPNTTYHVMNRGVNKMDIFRDRRDELEFIDCFRRYSSPGRFVDGNYREYRKLSDEVSVLTLALLENHFHMLIHQRSARGMHRLVHGALTGYSMYFNRRYDRDGPLFKGRYIAEPVKTAEHAKFVIAYTHLNDPIAQLENEFTTHEHFLGAKQVDWVDIDAGLALFGGTDKYIEFLDRTGPGIIAKKIKRRGLDPSEFPYRPVRQGLILPGDSDR